MFEKSNLLMKYNINALLNGYKSALIYSFMSGLVLGSLHFFYKTNENIKVQKSIQEERIIQIQNQEKICKKENSDYKKFLSLGFPKTAIEKFHICMREQ